MVTAMPYERHTRHRRSALQRVLAPGARLAETAATHGDGGTSIERPGS